MALLAALCAAFLTACSASSAASEPGAWRERRSAHFELKVLGGWAQASLPVELEAIHNRARMDLGPLAPWMDKERAKVYLYPDAASFHRGEFKPPPWSNGIAMHKTRTIAAYRQKTARELRALLAHEYAHLLFEGFFGERGATPPVWLNEGLACLAEDDQEEDPAQSPWARSLPALRASTATLTQFFASEPRSEQAREGVSLWYAQAYAMTRFLLREHSRMQFRLFCEALARGEPLEAALGKGYRYKTLREFELAWRSWLDIPEEDRRRDGFRTSNRGLSEFSPGTTRSFEPRELSR